jgi:hypothetical protein
MDSQRRFKSTLCEELKTGPRIYWHDRVNTITVGTNHP